MTHLYQRADLPAGCPVYVIKRYAVLKGTVGSVYSMQQGGSVSHVEIDPADGSAGELHEHANYPAEDVFKTAWECRHELRRRIGLMNEAYTLLVGEKD